MGTLSIVGLGLAVDDVTARGLRLIREGDAVYLEKYTSAILGQEEEIEKAVGRKFTTVYREDIEAQGEEDARVLREAVERHIVLLVVGTPLFATTHTELVIRAKELGIETNIVHNASIQSVTGCCGFNSYTFGRTVSIPFFLPSWRPYGFYQNILDNHRLGLHTLCLLDIKINEPTLNTLMGLEDKRYSKFMTIPEAVAQIKEAAAHFDCTLLNEIKIVGIEQFGSSGQRFTYLTLDELEEQAFGPPLHSLIIPSFVGNDMEKEQVERYFNAMSKGNLQ